VTHADWRTTTDAREFLAGAGPILQADPVENTLLLTIAHAAQGSAPGPTPLFGWHPGGGAFVHTPGFPLVLGPMAEAAATGLAATLGQHGRAISGVNGVPAAAQAFAARWLHTANPPASSRLFQRQRLFRLAELTPPPPPPGRARVATASDRELLIRWTDSFHREANDSGRPDSGPVVDSRLAYGGQLVWETGEPVSTAARTPVVGGMSRVAPVYTPPAQRAKGYGGAVTVAVSRAARQAGAREVVLFTDLANPTSNALYQRLGYRPVSDRHVLLFVTR
jgi:RimJ/RimL family protein N-acetyltransferase